MDGIVVLDKPAGITSAGAVNRVKRLLPRGTKIGHAGTLDPFATGVLLLLIGKATKRCESLMDQPKQYVATIKFGFTTETDDLESAETPWPDPSPPPTVDQIDLSLKAFTGQILQQPPIYSALRVGGRRAYDLARKGQTPQLQPRPVNVYSIERTTYHWPLLEVKVDCGRGTYIRSLARDIGADLNVGGHLTVLRRTRVGQYTVEMATRLETFSVDSIIPLLAKAGGPES